MIVLTLIQKLAELFFLLAAGTLLVKTGVLGTEDTKILSRISLYLLTPCVIISSYQVEMTPAIQQGLLGCLFFSVLVHALYIFLGFLFRKFLKATVVEQASVVYSNVGNMVIPIVASVLGREYVIYTSAYISVFNLLIWTHGLSLFTRDSRDSQNSRTGFRLSYLTHNVNILAICVGLIMMLLRIHLPGPAESAVNSLSEMIGPVSMLITGMILAGMHPADLFRRPRVYLVTALRNFLMPACALLLILVTGISGWVPDGKHVILVSFLSAMAPVANTITQLSILYDKDAQYSSALSVMTTLASSVSMPLLVYLYMALVG